MSALAKSARGRYRSAPSYGVYELKTRLSGTRQARVGRSGTHVDLGLANDFYRGLWLLPRLERDAEEGENGLLGRRQEVVSDEPDRLNIRLLCDMTPDAVRYGDDLGEIEYRDQPRLRGAGFAAALTSSGVSGSRGCLNG